MTSLLIITYLGGLTLQSLVQDPVKPSEGDTSVPVAQGLLPLLDVRQIQVIDEDDEPPVGGPWWDALVQFVDGMSGMFFLPEEDYTMPDPLIPPGWTELVDDDGHRVWVPEEAVSSATANGPYWRG